ncbi:MAG: hypothetical protein WCL02_04265 [bacterium]
MTNQSSTETLTGHFVAMEDEIINFQQGITCKEGRLGVFYDQKSLIDVIKANKNIAKEKIHIVKVTVPNEQIIHRNGVKFSYKSGPGVVFEEVTPFHQVV